MASLYTGRGSYGASLSGPLSFSSSSNSSQSSFDGGSTLSSCLVSTHHKNTQIYRPEYQENDAAWQVPHTHTNDVIGIVEERLKSDPVLSRVIEKFPYLARKITMTIDRQTSAEAHVHSQRGLTHYAERLFNDIKATTATHPLVGRAFRLPYNRHRGTHPAMVQICEELYDEFRKPSLGDLGILPDLLAWIHLPRTKLKVNELRHALKFSLDVNPPEERGVQTLDQLNRAADGFIRFENNDEEIIVPESLRRSLTLYYRATGRDQYQPYMGLVCLSYINATIGLQEPCPENDSLDRRLEEYPFLPYAVEHWASHVPPPSYNMECHALYLHDDRIIQSMMQIMGRLKLLRSSDREIKPDPSQWYYKNITRLSYAASIGCYPLVEAFLGKGQHPQSNSGYQPPLVSAAVNGHSHVVSLLLHYGADVHVQDFAGRTALYVAAVGGHIEIVQTLLNYQAGVNCRTKDHMSPLMAAICNGHLEIAKVLFQHGGKCTSVASDGHTPLSYAIMKPGFSEFAITMFKNSLGPVNLHLSKESDVTLWEAYSGIQDYYFRQQVLDCIKTHDYLMASGTSIALRKDWNESLLSTLVPGICRDPVVDIPAKAKETRKRLGMIRALSNEFRQRYMLDGFLGKGAFSSAWKAIDLVTGRLVVAKFLMETSNHCQGEDSKNEYRLMGKMNHENVLKCLDVMETKAGPIMITEFAQWGDLQHYLRHCCPVDHRPHCLPERIAKFAFGQLMKGLSYMHANNVVHRDLKPENILVFENNTIKIADFGNSIKIPECHNGYVDFIPCTLTHIAPEAMRDGSETDERCILAKPCDIYSAGVCLYQILVAKQPFPTLHGDSHYHGLRRNIIVGDLHFDDWDLWGSISDMAVHLVARMMDHDPHNRPTADEVLQHPWITGDLEKAQMLDLRGLRTPHGQADDAFVSRSPEWVVRSPSQIGSVHTSFSDDLEQFRLTQHDWITGIEPGLPTDEGSV